MSTPNPPVDGHCVPATHPHVGRCWRAGWAEGHASRDAEVEALREALGEALGWFTFNTHPGRACKQSGHIDVEAIERLSRIRHGT